MIENRSPEGATPAIMTIDDAFAALQAERESVDTPTPEVPADEPSEGDAETANLDAEEPVEGEGVDGEPDEEEADEGDDVEPDAEEEAEDDDAADDEEEAPSEEEADTKHRLRIGDEELEVTTEELKSGYLRDRDYRQKTQALAERRRELDSAEQQIEADRRLYRERAEAYEKIVGQLESVVDAEGKQFERIDWAKLKSDDLSEYLVKREEFRDWQDRKRAADAERERLARERQSEQAKEAEKARSALQKTLYSPDYFPHWADKDKAAADVQAMEAAAVDLGFSRDELAQTLDPRAWKLLWKAAQYDKFATKKGSATTATKQAKAAPETKPQAVKVLKPHAARPAPMTGQAAALKKVNARLRSDKPFATADEAFEIFQAQQRATRRA